MGSILPWKECSRDWHPDATCQLQEYEGLLLILGEYYHPMGCWMSVSSETGLPRDWNPNIIAHWRWLMTEVDWCSIKISTFIRRLLQNFRGKFALGFMESSSLSNPSSLNWIIKKWSVNFIQKWDFWTFKVLTVIGPCCERTFPKKAMYRQGSSLRGKIRFPNPRKIPKHFF